MKKCIVSMALLLMGFMSLAAFSQTEKEPEPLGLPGDNLDLYAVLNLFQKSKTIEDFEKSLNDQKTGINNLDLNLDKKVDFIKVVTKQNGQSFQFILQDAVSEKETQDVAVILVDKDKAGKVTMQIVGDKELYGPNYIVEPGKSSVTANPGYSGTEPVKQSTPATTTTVIVEQVPVVQYVYSPAYVPYYPPYYYGYYPPYFAAFTVMAVGIYRHNNYYHHHGYGYHNTTVIHNENNFNNYNGNRNTSDRVSHNNSNGRYNEGNRGSSSNRPSAGTSDRPSNGGSASNRPSAGTSDRGSGGASGANRPSTMESNRSSGGASAGSMESGRTRSGGGGNYGGGGYSGGGHGGGGGMSRGGGGGGGRRR